MKKQDLKSGMIIETINGDRYLLIGDTMKDHYGYLTLKNYSNDLKNKFDKIHDVVKVYNSKSLSLSGMFRDDNLDIIWERKEIELTDREIEVLKALSILGYKSLARDVGGHLHAYDSKPEKYYLENYWLNGGSYCQITKKDNNLFNFIDSEDEEPVNIDDLLKENEK